MAVIYYPKNQLLYIRDTTSSASNYESVVLAVSPNTVLYFDTGSGVTAENAMNLAVTASWALSASVSLVYGSVTSASWATASISASYSATASWASQSLSSSYGVTSSYLNSNLQYYSQYGLQTSTVVSSTNTLPVRKADPITFIAGDKIYIIGGWNNILGQGVGSTSIYTASIDSPEKVGDSGATFPVNICRASIVSVSGSLYMYGGNDSKNYIHTASVSNPLLWYSSSNVLPVGISQHSSLVIGNKIWIFFGQSPSGYSSASYSASVSTPTIFGLAGSGIAGANTQGTWQGSVVANGSTLYSYYGMCWGLDGNFTANTRIFTASVSNPAVWGIGASGLSIPGGQSPPVSVGGVTYFFGGYNGGSLTTNGIYSFSSSAPFTPIVNGDSVPQNIIYQSRVVGESSAGIPFVAMYGGGTPTSDDGYNYIWTGSISKQITSTAPATDFTSNLPWKYLQYSSTPIPYPIIVATASYAITAIQALSAISASWVTPSNQVSASQIIGSDYILTGSYVNFISSSYTMSVIDNGALLSVSGSSAVNLFLTSSLPYGFNCTIYQSGSGKPMVFTSSIGTILRNRQGLSGSAGQYALMSLIRIQNGEFILAGDTA